MYRGSADDARDGYIHFSTASQLAETVRKHYFGQTGLFLIAVDADALGKSCAGRSRATTSCFPHLYGELDLGAVTDDARAARAVRRRSRAPGAKIVIRAFDAFSLPLVALVRSGRRPSHGDPWLAAAAADPAAAGRSKARRARVRAEFSQSDRHGRGLRQERGGARRAAAARLRLCRDRHGDAAARRSAIRGRGCSAWSATRPSSTALGFNNDGAEVVLRRLAPRAHHGGIVGVNVGANKDSADRTADYVKLIETVRAGRELLHRQRLLAEHAGPAQPAAVGRRSTICWRG